MDDITLSTPDTIQYTDYEYFNADDAKKWVLDVVKYCVDIKHKDYITFSEYVRLVKGYKQYLSTKGIKLISTHVLLDDEDTKFYEYISDTWGMSSSLTDLDGDTAYYIPPILLAHKLDKFSNPYFDLLQDKQSVTIRLIHYTLSKLINFDYHEIEKVYSGRHIFTPGTEPKFYYDVTSNKDTLKYPREFVKTKLLGNIPNSIAWDIFSNSTNECVAVCHLSVEHSTKTANLDIILTNDISERYFDEVIKLIKEICFNKLGLTKIVAVNYNGSFAYSALNTLYHFAGFKPTYDTDHSTFVAEVDTIPTIDELYTSQQSIIDKVVIDI